MYFYLIMARAYQWTQNQVDEMDLEFFWDLQIVGAETDTDSTAPAQGYIDQIL